MMQQYDARDNHEIATTNIMIRERLKLIAPHIILRIGIMSPIISTFINAQGLAQFIILGLGMDLCLALSNYGRSYE